MVSVCLSLHVSALKKELPASLSTTATCPSALPLAAQVARPGTTGVLVNVALVARPGPTEPWTLSCSRDARWCGGTYHQHHHHTSLFDSVLGGEGAGC